MMATSMNITVSFNELETKILLFKEDAIRDLKREIWRTFSIKPSKQIIKGYLIEPTNDKTLLMDCLNTSDEIYLTLERKNKINQKNNDTHDPNHRPLPNLNTKDSEDLDCLKHQLVACMGFKKKFINNLTYVMSFKHQISTLRKFITLLTEEKSMGVLYFFNTKDSFAENFFTVIHKIRETKWFEKIHVLGWDIEETTYHNGLIRALNEFPQLSFASSIVKSKQSCALILVPQEKDIKIFSEIREFSQVSLIQTLKKASRLFKKEEEEVQEKYIDIFTSKFFHKLMADRMGGKDYDSFNFDQHEQLKSKIGFAFYGIPKDEFNYTKKQSKKIDVIYNVIVRESNLFSKFKDPIQIGFIYNCTEPLSEEKEERAKQFSNYVPKTDLCPVFVLRKCRDSENPCRVFVDHTGRVYDTWTGYLEKNKIGECLMVVPKNGMYKANEKGEVWLEKYYSPACGMGSTILQTMDIGRVHIPRIDCFYILSNGFAVMSKPAPGAALLAILGGARALNTSRDNEEERTQHSGRKSVIKFKCDICKGHYYITTIEAHWYKYINNL